MHNFIKLHSTINALTTAPFWWHHCPVHLLALFALAALASSLPWEFVFRRGWMFVLPLALLATQAAHSAAVFAALCAAAPLVSHAALSSLHTAPLAAAWVSLSAALALSEFLPATPS
eukprot:14748044-Ditylum_brightwellii.AAC.1